VPVKSVQERNLTVGITTLIASSVLLLWFFCWSGVAGRIRGWAFSLVVLACLFLAIFYRYDGVSGDMLPKFALRFGAVDLPELKSTEASPGSTIVIPPGAADYPQFLGPSRNLRVPALQLDTDWTKTPPKLLWKVAVGQGWGGFVVSGGYAVTQEQRESKELVVCYALATGKIVWSHADDARHDDPLGGVGPRATPTIYQGKVFSQGAQGMLNCIDLATGKLIWAKNIITEFAGKEPEYGLACSPLIYGDTVISAPGGSQGSTLVALSIADGMRVWLSGTQEASYSSPVLGMLHGREVLFYFGPVDLMACEPTSGCQKSAIRMSPCRW
jgi:outer membrane protein assembly factor BamB